MGKRRSLKPGGKDEPSDDEDDYEELEPLKPEQIEEIHSRKKLTAKRRINDSSSVPQSSPFTGFAGFKGLGATTSASVATPTLLQNGKTETLVEKSKLLKTTDESLTTKTSLFSNVSKQHQQIESTTTTNKTNFIDDNPSSSNINEVEVNFIQELNKLYEKYYGTKREYKIPSHLIDNNESDSTNYAHLLMELNKRCSKWIGKHVEESPFVYLTPIFIDYFNYLIQLEKKFFPATLFSKPENGIQKTTGITQQQATNDLFNGTKSFETTSNVEKKLATVEPSKPSSLLSSSSLLLSKPLVEENAIKFPPSVSAFKFSPNPLTTTTTTTPILSATPTVTTPKVDIFGSNSSSPSTFKFGVSSSGGSTETTLQTFSTTSSKAPTTVSSPSPSIFNKTASSTLTDIKKAEDSTPVTFSFGKDNSIKESTANNSQIKDSTIKSDFFSSITKVTTTQSTVTSSPTVNTFSFNQQPPTSATKSSNLFSFNSSTQSAGGTPAVPVSSLFSSTQSAAATTTAPGLFSSTQQATTASSLFSSTQPATDNFFSFIQNKSTAPSTSTTATTTSTQPAGGFFSMLTKSENQSTTKPFTFGNNLAPLSSVFGGAGTTSFGFGQTAQASNNEGGEEGGEGGDEAYEPPKPEVKEILENGALYSKRVKLYYFNTESNQYADKGVGNLHIKPTSDGVKKQMIIRADTSLGNILLNVALTKQIPVSKASKNSILMVCIANPSIPKHDEKAPCKFLIKVKTEEDADELFDKLKEMKT